MSTDPSDTVEAARPKAASVRLTYDRSINYAFQQNAIPVIKEIAFENDATTRKDLVLRVTTEPAFAFPTEIRLAAIAAEQEYRTPPVDLRLSHDFLADLGERVAGWIRVEVVHGQETVCSVTEPVALLARNEWCGLVSLPEILAAFILPNDPAVITVLGRAAELLREHAGRSGFNGYQDKNRSHAWDQVAAIYRAIGELGIRYIVPPASFESTGQKVRFPSDILEQRFGTCLDLALLFAACCEQAGLHPLVMIHEGHAYAGCWLEQRTLPEASTDDLQYLRKLATEELVTVFECTTVASENAGVLQDAEREAAPHLRTNCPFRLLLDVRRARLARIHPLPIPGQAEISSGSGPVASVTVQGIGTRTFADVLEPTAVPANPASRIDHWKSRLLDLSLRNRLLNFKETKSTVQVLSSAPDQVEDHLAADVELALQPKPRLMSERDPRHAATYTKQQREDALAGHLKDELAHKRLHTSLEDGEHSKRLTELFRAARTAIEENGTNTLFTAVGILEWRETEHSDRVLRAPLLLVPVELKRKSVIEGFSLRRLDEETRLNVTLMEMLRQHFQKTVNGLEPLPEDENGVDVPKVFRIFRDAVRDLAGWEVKEEIWLGQFSFTKFLLWNDLSTRLEQLVQNPVVNHLVNRAGIPYPNRGDDIRATELDRRFEPRQVFCPRSADSSQLAAVMAAAAGQDFILEGPPGTGKSQTITNIIAHCLAEGKRVLFVAEKRAALDVVHRRLREDGLEPFCLELHSNKAGKADVLQQFDRTLKFTKVNDPSEWERRAEELGRLRSNLNEYAQALHRRYPSGLSAYDCADYLLPRQEEPTVSLSDWPQILATSADSLEAARTLARQVQERSRELMPLAEHGLAPVAREEWTPAWAEKTVGEVRELLGLLEAYSAAARDLRRWLRAPEGPVSRAALANLSGLIACLSEPRHVGPGFARTPWAELGTGLEQWASLARDRAEQRQALAAVHEPVPEDTPLSRPETWSVAEAEQILRQLEDLRRLASQFAERAGEFREWLNAPATYKSKEALAHLDALARSLVETPLDLGGPFVTARWDRTKTDLARWIELVRERVSVRGKLTAYDERKLLALDLDAIDRMWRSAGRTWFLPKWLRTRRVQKDLRSARTDGARAEVTELSNVLAAGLRLRAINAELREASELAGAVLGPAWRKCEPDAEELARALAWGSSLHERIERATKGQDEWAPKLRARLGQLLSEGRAAFLSSASAAVPLTPYRSAFEAFTRSYEGVVPLAQLRRTALEEAPDHLGILLAHLSVVHRAALRARTCTANLAAAHPVASVCLGPIWRSGEPEAEAIRDAHTWGAALHASLRAVAGEDLPWLAQLREQLAALFAEGPAAYALSTATGARFTKYQETRARFDAALEGLAVELRLRRDPIDTALDYLPSATAVFRRIEAAWPSIRPWCSWQKARREAWDRGLARIVEKLESSEGAGPSVPTLFERSFRRAFFFAVLEAESVLRDFFGREHEERIARFREVDEEVSALTSSLVQARLAAAIPRESVKDSAPTAEIGLLRKEIGKKARHIPVRQLLSRIPRLLPRLKPCVLMSPLSVAQYLDTTQDQFHVVIFDEASQIPVWDAVGAIARGKQLIVVGDPKQLPPTNFFNTNDEDEDDLTPAEQKDLESILDELLSNGVRHKRLQWHYRSRHEGLITFSNRLYYENDLLTFPSPTTEHAGVRFMHLPHARYDKGKSRTNKAEAEALVKELVTRLRKTDGPARSYGVVTFSQAQQKLVEDLLDEERRKHPEIEDHFGDDPPVEGEPVFVKNLENVQGDERDVILFSICYGPDESGRVSMNFGPMNRDGGERRLNVAVTRAKHEVLVISGLRADQIDLTRTRSKGVRDLKSFLDYAERGPRALVAASSASGDAGPESEFERMVADRIRAAGYDVHHQVGCSGYRIDLGIVDPKAPGRYLLGVECDGATYHRAATARDRDKLRQSVLEGLGWELHRIWSTDWWHDANGETQKLLARLTELQAAQSQPPRPG